MYVYTNHFTNIFFNCTKSPDCTVKQMTAFQVFRPVVVTMHFKKCLFLERNIFQVRWKSTSGPTGGESFGPQPVGKPSHVTVAVERVGDQVEAGHRGQLVKGPRSDAANEVAVKGQRLEVVQASEHCSVHHSDLILWQKSGNNNAALINQLLIYFFSEV